MVHVATDWPGRFPNVAATLRALASAGADVNARMAPHPKDPNCVETPLHWAASSNDVVAIDALLDLGADIEAPGAIFTGGAPLSDAVTFANWEAARRLVERGARPTWWQGAALGMLDLVTTRWHDEPLPTRRDYACLLARLPRRAAADGRLSPGAWGRPELDRLGPDDAAAGRRGQWRCWVRIVAAEPPLSRPTSVTCQGRQLL
jgi:hypothetical protein